MLYQLRVFKIKIRGVPEKLLSLLILRFLPFFYLPLLLLSFSSCTDNNKTLTVPNSDFSLDTTPQIKIDLPQNPTLDNLIAYALSNNPKLKAIYFNYLSHNSNYKAKGRWPLPQIAYTWYMQQVETRVGPQRHRFSLAQKFPWPGKLSSQKETARQLSIYKLAKYNIFRNILLFQLKKKWFELSFLASSLKILKDYRQTLNSMLELAQVKYKTTRLNYSHLAKIKVELGKLSNSISTMRTQIQNKKDEIKAYLGDDKIKFKAPNKLPPPVKLPQMSTLLKLQKANHPQLEQFKHQIQLQKSKIKASRKKSMPDFFLKFTYIETGESEMEEVIDNGKDPMLLTFGLSLPLWRDSFRHETKSAKYKLQESRMLMKDLKNHLVKKLRISVKNYLNARQVLDNYENKLVKEAELGFKLGIEAYVAGKDDLFSVWSLARSVQKLKLGRVKARLQLRIHKAKIERITGITLDGENKGSDQKGEPNQ
ncbi:MAG: TolC family protein [Myxococcota bacterium]